MIYHLFYFETIFLSEKKRVDPGLKVLFINYMINTGGNMFFLLSTAAHRHIFVISDFHDEELLKTIDKVKV